MSVRNEEAEEAEEREERESLRRFHESMNRKIAEQEKVVAERERELTECIQALPLEERQEEGVCEGEVWALVNEQEKLDKLLHDLGYMG